MRYSDVILESRKDEALSKANQVIRKVKAFARNKPIRIEMRPYLNRYTGACQGIVLTDLFADQPGNGVGTEVMKFFIAQADATELNIHTDAEGPRSTEFYKKLGFEKDKNSGHQLVHYSPIDLDEAFKKAFRSTQGTVDPSLDLTFEGVGEDHWTPERVAYYTNYWKNRKFASPEEARAELFRKLELWDKESWSQIFGPNGPEKNKAIADAAPVFKIGNSYKIGKRTVTRKKEWQGVEVKRPSIDHLVAAGWLNPFDGYEVLGIKEMPVKSLTMTEDHSFTDEGTEQVYAIAQSIKDDEWFRAIIVSEDGTILDGHHRFRAVRDVLKWKTIPALVIRIGGGD